MLLSLLYWGAVLNFLAYRLLYGVSLIQWPACVVCKTPNLLHDLIPVLSWYRSQGKCRSCHQNISWLFPAVEILTVVLCGILFFTVSSPYQYAYFLFFSALIITIRTDLEAFLILRVVTLWLIPCGMALSILGLLPISFIDSCLGSAVGYTSLWLISVIFYRLRGFKGLGEGDPELLASIGAFTGLLGCWSTLIVGSSIGSIVGIYLLATGRATRTTYLPFGPFLAFGAILYILFNH